VFLTVQKSLAVIHALFLEVLLDVILANPVLLKKSLEELLHVRSNAQTANLILQLPLQHHVLHVIVNVLLATLLMETA